MVKMPYEKVDSKEFGEYLRKVRKESNLTIRKLEELSGVSNAYLSQLENGKRGVPSIEILHKLSQHLDVSYNDLLRKAGYVDYRLFRNRYVHQGIDEFAEEKDLEKFLYDTAVFYVGILIDLLKQSDDNNLMEEFRKRTGLTDTNLPLDAETFKEEILSELDSKILLLTVFNMMEFINEHYNGELLINRNNQRELITKYNSKSDADVIRDVFSPVENPSVIRVPVIGQITAGLPILAQEHIEEWTDIPNMWHLKEGEVFVLRVKGDSMIGSRIYEGDRVIVKVQPYVENGEVAVVNVNGDDATLKRVKRTDDGQIILFPDNPKYDPILLNHEKARIIGKVVQVMFEPRSAI
jgi:SOS regulatory protein LexA